MLEPMDATFLLVHSPSVGPSTWNPVAAELRARRRRAVVPTLTEVTSGPPPYWPRVVDQVSMAAPDGPVVVVAHSNAGLYVPLVAERLRGQVTAVLFVDAALPPRRGSIPAAESDHLTFLGAMADENGLLPRWTDWWPEEMVSALVPDRRTRDEIVAEQPRLPLLYYSQHIPVPHTWDRVRGAYLWFSDPYERTAKEADERGWPVTRIPGDHLHQVVAPGAVADWLISVS